MTRDLIDGLCMWAIIAALIYLPWILKGAQ